MNKNILEVCFSPDLGGLELHVKNFAAFLGAKSIVAKDSKLEKLYKDSSLEYDVLNRYSFFALAKIIDKNNIDVLHIHWTKDIPVAVLAKLLSKKKPKLIQTRHMHMTRFKDDFYHKFLYKNIDTIIAVTQLVKEQLQKFLPVQTQPNIEFCYLGANNPEMLSSETKHKMKLELGLQDSFVVAIVGRIEEAKGQHIVLEALDLLRKNKVDSKGLIVGSAMDQSYLETLMQKYPKDIFTGFVTNTSELIQIADCVVLATKKETFGLVLIEAMKCGVCVLGSNQGGPLEIIEDQKSGLLFESMNANSLYEKLLLLVQDSLLKEKLAEAGRARSNQDFDAQKQFKKLQEIVER